MGCCMVPETCLVSQQYHQAMVVAVLVVVLVVSEQARAEST